VTYPEAIDWLYDLRLLGSKLGLDKPRQLAALAGNPQEQLQIIHVAGTNGKGSVCAMLESMYRAAGYRTGLFTSPHLVSFRERIQINRECIPEAEVVVLVKTMRQRLREFPADASPTFFEVITVMALETFARQQCDVVLLETGLGGRLDATNIVTPLASVITPVDLDHQQYLGETLPEIAAEKAGIIKPGVPVFSARQELATTEVIQQTAETLGAPYTQALAEETPTALLGRHQRENASLAKLVAERTDLTIRPEAIHAGLTQVHWAARGQCHTVGSKQVVIDAAHNPASAKALADVLQEEFPGQRPTLLIGMLADKNWEYTLALLAPLAARVVCVPVSSDRSLAPVRLVKEAQSSCEQVEHYPSVAVGLAAVQDAPLVVVTGSLYLIGEVIEQLDLMPAAGERGLNEWKLSKP
jgi:dihydrofolate synthase / folylpolyglutamate synthase